MTRYCLVIALWLALTLAAPLRYLWWGLLALTGSPRAWRLALAEDRAWNVPWGGADNRLISTRAGLAARQGRRWGCILCRLLDAIDPGHCEQSINSENGGEKRAG